MTWRGPQLDSEQRAVARGLDTFVTRNDVDLDDARPQQVAELRAGLAALGMWTIGAAESHGGGAGSQGVVAVTVERVARRWPALGWALVQSDVATDILSAAPQSRLAGTVAALHDGGEAVAVLEASAGHVDVTRTGDRIVGRIERVDACSATPGVILLTSGSTAIFIAAPAVSGPIRRTGLAGAQTCALEIDARIGEDAVEITGLKVDALRARLALGAAAVAAGIAGAAVDQALAYTATREQFGAPLTALPTVRQSLINQSARTSAILAQVIAADPAGAAGVLVLACGSAIDICAEALQCHGGYGYMQDYPAERYLRDAVSLRAAADAFAAGISAGAALVGIRPPALLEADAVQA